MELTDFFQNDERLAGIFGTGRVLVTKPTGSGPTELVEPSGHVKTVVEKYAKMSADFNNITTRGKFLREAHADSKTQYTVDVLYQQKKLSITTSIKKEHVKEFKVVNCGDAEIPMPMIKAGYLKTYDEKFCLSLNENLERAADVLEGLGRTMDIPETRKKIMQLSHSHVRDICQNDDRRACTAAILGDLLVRLYLTHQCEVIVRHFAITDLLADEYTSGSFIRLDDSQSAIEDRLATMVQPNAVGVDINPVYSLNYRQLGWLTRYIFSKDPGERCQCKVDLLSAVKPSIRNDIVLSPESVLHASIREYCLTREELVHLFFNEADQKRSPTCIHCQTNATIVGLQITHQACAVTTWLAKHYQFVEARDFTSTCNYAYVKPGVTAVARSLVQMQKVVRSKTFVGADDKEVTAYALNGAGEPKKIGSSGVRYFPIPSVQSSSRSGYR